MTDFSKILENAKKMQSKMKESQDKIKALELEGYAAGGSVKVMLNGEGEMIKLFITPETLKESKEIIEDLIIAAHNDAKQKIKLKTSEELSKITGGYTVPQIIINDNPIGGFNELLQLNQSGKLKELLDNI